MKQEHPHASERRPQRCPAPTNYECQVLGQSGVAVILSQTVVRLMFHVLAWCGLVLFTHSLIDTE